MPLRRRTCKISLRKAIIVSTWNQLRFFTIIFTIRRQDQLWNCKSILNSNQKSYYHWIFTSKHSKPRKTKTLYAPVKSALMSAPTTPPLMTLQQLSILLSPYMLKSVWIFSLKHKGKWLQDWGPLSYCVLQIKSP